MKYGFPESVILAIAALVVLIGCGPSERPERETTAAEEPGRTTEPTPESQPFRISGDQIVTDTFDVRYDVRDGRLAVALDTDLGDSAKLMVSVSRSYRQRGSDEEYPIDYFSESSSVGAWCNPRIITIDHDRWKRELEKRQKVLAAAGEPFTVSRVSDDIKIGFVVPVNQQPPFERWNANLTGDAVEQSGDLRIVRQELEVSYPLNATNIGQTRFADPLGLLRETTYRASGELPLVPQLDPPDPIAAIASIQRLNPGEEFTVLETTTRRNTPWYRVRTPLGEGWINSTALLGQEIVVVR